MKIKNISKYLKWSLVIFSISMLYGVILVSENVAFADEFSDGITYPYTKTFTISAYYSPLPCQSRYVTGSYSGDVRLNGEGVNSADGSLVYPGMVAAPKIYAFGTKMEIPGIGVVAVHDRGGAIVGGNGINSYDRLDVWMGYGDKGLQRALNWGKRTMDVVVYGIDDGIVEQVTFDGYDESEAVSDCSGSTIEVAEVNSYEDKQIIENPVPVKTASVESIILEKSVKSESNEEISIYPVLTTDLRSGDSGPEVTVLQVHLKKLNFFRTEITGNFGDVTKHAVFKFQQSQGLVPDESSPYAGIFGPKTRERLNEIIRTANYNNVRIASATTEYNRVMVAKMEADRPRKELITIQLEVGMNNPEVAKLQKILKELGFFDGALITQYYGPVTQRAVLKFQKSKNIIKSENDLGAGRVGPETMEIINTMVT